MMERKTRDLPTSVLLAIAPTRALFDLKFMEKRIAINRWSWLFLLMNLMFLFTFPLLSRHLGFWEVLCVLLWGLPFSNH